MRPQNARRPSACRCVPRPRVFDGADSCHRCGRLVDVPREGTHIGGLAALDSAIEDTREELRKAAMKAGAFDDPAEYRAWLMGVAKRRVRTRERSSRPARRLVDLVFPGR